MNIFYISRDPEEAARGMCDKHIVKMPTESAQMLSTAHRLLDGELIEYEYWSEEDLTRVKKMWMMPGEVIKMRWLDNGKLRPSYTHPSGVTFYAPTHAVHPSCVWTMDGDTRYSWHFQLLRAMLDEYTRRYNRKHAVEQLVPLLERYPNNIPLNVEYVDPPLSMPEQYKIEDHVEAYRDFYVGEKASFAKWKNGNPPDWFIKGINENIF